MNKKLVTIILLSVMLAASALALPLRSATPGKGYDLPAETPVVRVVVKFHEGTHARLRAGRLEALERDAEDEDRLARLGLEPAQVEGDLVAAELLLRSNPSVGEWQRLFQLDEELLTYRQQNGEILSGRQLAALNLYFDADLLVGSTYADVAALVASSAP